MIVTDVRFFDDSLNECLSKHFCKYLSESFGFGKSIISHLAKFKYAVASL